MRSSFKKQLLITFLSGISSAQAWQEFHHNGERRFASAYHALDQERLVAFDRKGANIFNLDATYSEVKRLDYPKASDGKSCASGRPNAEEATYRLSEKLLLRLCGQSLYLFDFEEMQVNAVQVIGRKEPLHSDEHNPIFLPQSKDKYIMLMPYNRGVFNLNINDWTVKENENLKWDWHGIAGLNPLQKFNQTHARILKQEGDIATLLLFSASDLSKSVLVVSFNVKTLVSDPVMIIPGSKGFRATDYTFLEVGPNQFILVGTRHDFLERDRRVLVVDTAQKSVISEVQVPRFFSVHGLRYLPQARTFQMFVRLPGHNQYDNNQYLLPAILTVPLTEGLNPRVGMQHSYRSYPAIERLLGLEVPGTENFVRFFEPDLVIMGGSTPTRLQAGHQGDSRPVMEYEFFYPDENRTKVTSQWPELRSCLNSFTLPDGRIAEAGGFFEVSANSTESKAVSSRVITIRDPAEDAFDFVSDALFQKDQKWLGYRPSRDTLGCREFSWDGSGAFLDPIDFTLSPDGRTLKATRPNETVTVEL